MTRPDPPKRRPFLRRVLIILILIPILTYAGICAIMYFKQTDIIYPRSFAGPSTVDAPGLLGSEVWWIDGEKGEKTEAWWMPTAPKHLEGGPAPAVIFFHGNGELIENSLDLARIYLAMGVHVAFIEYRGYGRSGGTPSQDAIVHDASILYDRLLARPDVDPKRIILHGRSLGGGVACALIAHHPPGALILESTFTSILSFTSRYYVPAFLCKSPFCNDKALATYDGPTLLLHGENDTIIPVANSRTLAKIARHPTLITNDRDHNDFGTDWKWYSDTIEHFLRDNHIVTPKK